MVIGASMGGLFAALVLAPHVARVTVLDRDALPDDTGPRKAVPQGHHPHLLMGAGLALMTEHFPDIEEELVAGGAIVRGWEAVAWHYFGSWRPRIGADQRIVHCTRPYLEWHVRRRVAALPNVEIRGGTAVTGLLSDPAHRVTGVRATRGDEAIELLADLVVDASGAGSKAPDWLEGLGFARPPESKVGIQLAYTSRLYKAPPDFPTDPSLVVIYPNPPGQHRGGFLFSQENGRWLVSLNGYFGDHAPKDDAGFLAFARSLSHPYIADRLAELEPLSDYQRYSIPADLRRHYERLGAHPEGFVVMGDAATRFNPVFGQGMSAAALGARALAQTLASGGVDGAALPRRFYRAQAAAMDVPWLLTSSTDLRYDRAEGERPLWMSGLHWYTGHLLRLCGEDPAVYRSFLGVLHMLKGLGPVLRPDVVAKVVLHAARGARPGADPTAIPAILAG